MNDCVGGIIASAGVLAIAATGPTGWLALGGAAGTAGFATGWSCAALYYNGD